MTSHPNYFDTLDSVEAIKKHYRALAMQHHPDLGGDLATMQDINRQYQDALKARDGQQNDGHAYRYMPDIEQELMDKLHELLKLRGLDIALIDYWLSVSGDTKRNKDALKAVGLLWHSKRGCWYYKPKDWKRSRQSNASLDELASKYGYRGFATADKETMPAVTQVQRPAIIGGSTCNKGFLDRD